MKSKLLLGASSAAHQVEGNNIYSNWWHEEQLGKLPKSGQSANHYQLYDSDFALAKNIGLQAMRISIEWSRIEPQAGQYNFKEVEHYRAVLQSMKNHGLVRMVTLFHFTLPQWAAEMGGMESKKVVKRFAEFAKFIAEQLGDEIDLWVTVNEPEVYVLLGYWRGVHPPFTKYNLWKCAKVVHRLIQAHNGAYLAIKSVLSDAQIGMAKNNVHYEAYRKNNWLDVGLVKILKYFGNHYILNRTMRHSDYIGLNYYFHQVIKFSWRHGGELKNSEGPKSDMGWMTYPKGLYFLLKDLAQYNKPIYITENGIANANDQMRQRFIEEHIAAAEQALQEGVEVKGYFYWSLTDTYEWHDGYGPKFGLVEVNFDTLERQVRDSANVFKST